MWEEKLELGRHERVGVAGRLLDVAVETSLQFRTDFLTVEVLDELDSERLEIRESLSKLINNNF